jgi:hypothetical protein
MECSNSYRRVLTYTAPLWNMLAFASRNNQTFPNRALAYVRTILEYPSLYKRALAYTAPLWNRQLITSGRILILHHYGIVKLFC